MYYIYTINDTVRVPPNKFSENLEKALKAIVQEQYEGLVDEDLGVVVAVISAKKTSEGKVIPGDGAAYFDADIEFLAFKPVLQEIVEGTVSEITEFGAFAKTGPLEGLIHMSQIMDEFVNYDPALPGFVGKESGRKLLSKDEVLARIVTISMKGSIAESKIGLTMRQPGLGKEDWKTFEVKEVKKREKKVDKREKNVKE
ncbi:MAG: DNA-directed RNA polymerase [Candidatus Diapherotrites archaeon]